MPLQGQPAHLQLLCTRKRVYLKSNVCIRKYRMENPLVYNLDVIAMLGNEKQQLGMEHSSVEVLRG